MNFGLPVTAAGAAGAVVPAAMFVVSPVGAPAFLGLANAPVGFPFGVPFTVAGSSFFAIPAAALGIIPVAI